MVVPRRVRRVAVVVVVVFVVVVVVVVVATALLACSQTGTTTCGGGGSRASPGFRWGRGRGCYDPAAISGGNRGGSGVDLSSSVVREEGRNRVELCHSQSLGNGSERTESTKDKIQ